MKVHLRCSFLLHFQFIPIRLGMQPRYVLIREVILQRGIRQTHTLHLPLWSLKPVAFLWTATQDWKVRGGKQRGTHTNGPLWKKNPSGNSETTQRVSCRSVAFSTGAERARACWARPPALPWCLSTDTLPSGGKELGGSQGQEKVRWQPSLTQQCRGIFFFNLLFIYMPL